MTYHKSLRQESAICRVVNMYLERFPLTPHYGIELSSTEDDSHEKLYYKMSKEEMALLHAWQNNEEEMSLGEYLQSCIDKDSSGQYQDMYDRWIEHSSPFPLNMIDSCDLDNPLFFTRVGVRQLNDKNELRTQCTIGMQVSVEDMKQLLFIFIKEHNQVTFNQLMYLFPDFSARMNRHISWSLCDGVCETMYPFVLDMIEIKEMVLDICSPERDVLGLCAMEDEHIRTFLQRYELVPDYVELYDESGDEYMFHVLSYIEGHRLRLFQEEVSGPHDEHWPVESQYYDADLLCQTLGLDSYQALQNYMKEHYSTKTAFHDFQVWAEQNCGESSQDKPKIMRIHS